MPSTSIQTHLPFAAGELITLVADVERYPEFISAISALRVIGARTVTQTGETFEAEMRIAYKFLSERVRCHVAVDHASQRIDVSKSGNDGALRSLSNVWKFHSLSDGSTALDFSVDVELKSAPLNFLARQKFDEIAERVMAKFIARSHDKCTLIDSQSDGDIHAEMTDLFV